MCAGFLTQWAERLRTARNEHVLYIYKYVTLRPCIVYQHNGKIQAPQSFLILK